MRESTKSPDGFPPDGETPASIAPADLAIRPVEAIDFALPHLLPQPPRAFGLGGTIAVHIAAAALFLFIDNLPAPEPPITELSLGTRNVTKLVTVPTTHPLTLPELMAREQPVPQPQTKTAAPAPKPAAIPQFNMPARRPGPTAPEVIAEAPPQANSNQPLPQMTQAPINATPVIQQTEQPAQAQSQSSPKLAFETPAGQATGTRAQGGGRVPIPQSSVSELGRAMARPSTGGGLTVGDPVDFSPSSGGLSAPNSPMRNQSAVQMLTTDTMGVDFKPYLVTILASVRRNWLAILPESARMGRRGRVQVQFAISRDGSVPKLVISSGSGAEALDRAAVAGISASNPFPPLPSEFSGPQIRLQFTFAYNMQ